ncbi:HTH domain-containing protein [Clostridia bacterium]|nr:HTH domain-containing protein [Clostridia bacterium]
MNELKNRIKKLLISGKTWTRKELEAYLDVSDRMIRLAIHDLRDNDHMPICSSSASGKRGYWLAKSADEYLRFGEREYGSRIESSETSLAHVKQTAYEWEFDEVSK